MNSGIILDAGPLACESRKPGQVGNEAAIAIVAVPRCGSLFVEGQGDKPMDTFVIRPARETDCDTIVNLIRGLARYEHLEDQCIITPQLLKDSLFCKNPVCYSVVGFSVDDNKQEKPVAFALYFYNYSTFLGKKGLYLEDVFVLPEERRKGYGKKLLNYLAKVAKENDCGRFEWSVLDWNQSAIDFYQGLGAKVLPDWRICRVTGQELDKLAGAKS